MTPWRTGVLESEVVVYGDFLISAGAVGMEALLTTKRSNSTGAVVLGEGVFTYKGVQDLDHQMFTVWRMSMYGVVMDGDPRAPTERVSVCYVMTAPRGMKAATDLIRTMQNPRSQGRG